MNKRILFVSDTGAFRGGVERFIFQAAQLLASKGFHCSGAFRMRGEDSERFLAPFESYSFDPDDFAEMAENADLIWLHKCADCRILEPYLGRRPVMLYVHDHDYYCFRRHKYYPFRRINCTRACSSFCRLCGSLSREHAPWTRFYANLELAKQADLVLAGSGFMLDNLRRNGFAPDRLRKLEPLIDLHQGETPRRRPADREIVYTGQLLRGKGVDLLLHAAARLTGEWHLTDVGKGDDMQYCSWLARRLNLEKRVTFTGYTGQPEKYYEKAAVAVFPSRWQEPFGMTGPEAMAHGVPVAGFLTGGVGEWLKNGHNGFAVPSGDISALAGAIRRLLDHPAEAEAYGANAFQDMKQYTPETFSGKLISLMERFL